MVGRKHRDIPAPLARGRDRFDSWRRTRKAGTRIPNKLWSLAVKLADGHGLNRTASVLGLDYYSLKKRVAARKSDSTSVPRRFGSDRQRRREPTVDEQPRFLPSHLGPAPMATSGIVL